MEGKGRGREERKRKGREGKGEERNHYGLQPINSKCSDYVVKMRPRSRDSGYQHCNP